MIVKNGAQLFINPNFDVGALRPNLVFVPAISVGRTGERRRFSKLLCPAPTIRRDRHASATLDKQLSAMLVINAAEPGSSVVQIGLIAGSAAVLLLLRAKLNPGVRTRVALNSVFKLELEV